jgi:hypothetical protein
MRSYLVVANKTLTGPHLVAEVLACSRAEPSRFHVLVPATTSGGTRNWTEGAAHAEAQVRLDKVMGALRAAGVEITGEIGEESPSRAVGDVFRREQFDEIILSTLPPGASRWLKRDLPHRLARAYHVPVRHIVADHEFVS